MQKPALGLSSVCLWMTLLTPPKVDVMLMAHVTSVLICPCTHLHSTCNLMQRTLFWKGMQTCATRPHLHSGKRLDTSSCSSILHVDLTWLRGSCSRKDAVCFPLSFCWFTKGIFAYLTERDIGMCLSRWCHLARTSPEEEGVFRNVAMTTGSSWTRLS